MFVGSRYTGATFWRKPAVVGTLMEQVRIKRKIKDMAEWKNTPKGYFRSCGATDSFFTSFPTLTSALHAAFPITSIEEIPWREVVENRPSIVPKNYWTDNVVRDFVKEVFAIRNIRPKDAPKKMKQSLLVEFGGRGIIRKYSQKQSIFAVAFPDYTWEDPKPIHTKNVVKEVADPFIEELRIKEPRDMMNSILRKEMQKDEPEPKDWLSISRKQFWNWNDGKYRRLGNLSFHKLLRVAYPELESLLPKPPKYWSKKEHVRGFFEDFAKAQKCDIESIHLFSLQGAPILEHGGRGLRRYFNKPGGILDALAFAFPEKDWKEIGRNRSTPHAPYYWTNKENITKFMNKVAQKYEVRQPSDWERVSAAQMYSVGGKPLMTKYKLTLRQLLIFTYPDIDWSVYDLENKAKKAQQRFLYLTIKHLFPSCEVMEDAIVQEGDVSFELDIWIPSLRFGIEYQGKHHYEENPLFGPLELYQKLDARKVELCVSHDIALLVVPYWWDDRKESLHALILSHFPSLLPEFPNWKTFIPSANHTTGTIYPSRNKKMVAKMKQRVEHEEKVGWLKRIEVETLQGHTLNVQCSAAQYKNPPKEGELVEVGYLHTHKSTGKPAFPFLQPSSPPESKKSAQDEIVSRIEFE